VLNHLICQVGTYGTSCRLEQFAQDGMAYQLEQFAQDGTAYQLEQFAQDFKG